MSAPLACLRHDLARLRRRRAAVRLGTAFATAGIVSLAVVAAAFAVDYLGDLRPIPRAVALLVVAFGGGWVASSVVGAWLGGKEAETDLALMVERQHGSAGDLVAALQFQSAEAPAWGSPQLERAVIEDVEEASRDLDLFEGFTWKPLPARLALLALVLAMVIVPAVFFPRHAAAFLERLTLADVSYPTRTVVTSVLINGKPIDLADKTPLRAPAGAPLTFAATVEGVRPQSGTVRLESDGGGRTDVTLKAGTAEVGAAEVGDQTSEDAKTIRRGSDIRDSAVPAYSGTLDVLTEPVVFTVRLGDAATPPRRIELVPRPVVALDLLPTPPEYAQTNAPAAPPAGVRTAFVLEGSSVAVVVRGVNKPLDRVTVSVAMGGVGDKERGRQRVPLHGHLSPPPLSPSSRLPISLSPDRKTWTLDPTGTPFENIREPLTFTVTATDAEGLSPVEPIAGSIRLRADRPPRVAAGAVVLRVLPTARPELSYGATDDFGVKELRAKVTVNRTDGTTEETTVPLPSHREDAGEVQGRHPLDLSPYSLKKGDKVVVTVEAEDARGDRPGETASAEPITFEVTDREGLLASLLEADEEGAERLDEIIRRELGIGGQ